MKVDKYGFYVLDDEEEMDFTSTDNDDGDLIERERPWWEDESTEEEINDDEW